MSLRHKIAYRFGMIEHEAGRLMFIPIIATIIFLWFKLYQPALYASIITLIIAATYLIAHTLEKKAYGKSPRVRR